MFMQAVVRRVGWLVRFVVAGWPELGWAGVRQSQALIPHPGPETENRGLTPMALG